MKALPSVLLVICFAAVTVVHAYFAARKIAGLERRVSELDAQLRTLEAAKANGPLSPEKPPEREKTRVRSIVPVPKQAGVYEREKPDWEALWRRKPASARWPIATYEQTTIEKLGDASPATTSGDPAGFEIIGKGGAGSDADKARKSPAENR